MKLFICVCKARTHRTIFVEKEKYPCTCRQGPTVTTHISEQLLEELLFSIQNILVKDGGEFCCKSRGLKLTFVWRIIVSCYTQGFYFMRNLIRNSPHCHIVFFWSYCIPQ